MPKEHPSAGDPLRDWRQRRRLSQLALVVDAEISRRHLSFLESRRSQPSRDMVLRLTERLSVPLRERNLILTAAGFAPKYNSYARTNRGSPAKIRAPDAVGAYEIRYVVKQSRRVLTSQAVTLTPVSATLEILNTPIPEGAVEIAWTGPDNLDDYITVVEKAAPEDKYTDYARTNRGSPAKITMPKAVGAYEIRYVVKQSRRVLASVPVTLAEAAASLSAPGLAATGATLKVEWTGPANWEDFIEIVQAGAPADTKPLRETRTSQGSPLSIFAPASPGEYLIRYKMRGTGEVAAEIPLIVE